VREVLQDKVVTLIQAGLNPVPLYPEYWQSRKLTAQMLPEPEPVKNWPLPCDWMFSIVIWPPGTKTKSVPLLPGWPLNRAMLERLTLYPA
jgi:hypothetical protein